MAEAAGTGTGRSEINVENTPEGVKAIQEAWNNRNDKGSTGSLSNDTSQTQSDKGGTSKVSSSEETQKMIDSLTEETSSSAASDNVNIPMEQSSASDLSNTGNAGAITDENAAKKDSERDKKYWDAMLGNKKNTSTGRSEVNVENTPEGVKAIRNSYYENLHPTNVDNTQKVKNEINNKIVNPIKEKVNEVKNKIEEKKQSIHKEFANPDNTLNDNNARKISLSNLKSLSNPAGYNVRQTVDATELPENASQQVLPKGASEEQKQQILAKAYDDNVKNKTVKATEEDVQKAVDSKKDYDNTIYALTLSAQQMDKAEKSGDMNAVSVHSHETANKLDYLFNSTPQDKISPVLKGARSDWQKKNDDIEKRMSELDSFEKTYRKQYASSESDKAAEAANKKARQELIREKRNNDGVFGLLSNYFLREVANDYSNTLGDTVKAAQESPKASGSSGAVSDETKAAYNFNTYNQDLQEMAKTDPVYAKAYTDLTGANDLAEKIKAGDMNSTEELADILSSAREKLSGVKKDNNFSKKMNTQIAVIATEAYLGTQAYSEGYNSDNSNSNIADRIGKAYNGIKSGKASFADAMAYVAGIGNGEKYSTKNQQGVNKLREIAMQTAFGTNYISDETKGALLSSVMMQDSDDSKTGRVAAGVGTVLQHTTAAAALALGGFTIPSAVAVVSYCAYQDNLKVGKIGTYEARQKENESRLKNTDKNGNIQRPSPSNSAENIYNTMQYGAGKDIANVNNGISEVISGFISAASGNITASLGLIGDGVRNLMKIESTKQAVDKFVGKTGFGAEGIAELTNVNESGVKNLDIVSEKKNKDTEDIQIEETEGNRNDENKGKFNQPVVDSETLKWLVRSNPQIYGNIVR